MFTLILPTESMGRGPMFAEYSSLTYKGKTQVQPSERATQGSSCLMEVLGGTQVIRLAVLIPSPDLAWVAPTRAP